jgi:hypothetical protein
MLSLRFLQLSLAMFIAFIYGYFITVSLMAIMIGLGTDFIIASTVALVLSTYSSLTVTDKIEAIAEKIATKIVGISSFFKEKKEEFDAYNFNRKNCVYLIS